MIVLCVRVGRLSSISDSYVCLAFGYLDFLASVMVLCVVSSISDSLMFCEIFQSSIVLFVVV